ncbi:MAG: hypothetical protein OEM97_01635, partial [Acidimicrobiia bacterium]|nr:hypothetical protein [Acidimicrobiia bacterium]
MRPIWRVLRALITRPTRARRTIAWFTALTILATTLILSADPQPAVAASPNTCYLVADSGSPHTSNDLFTIYQRSSNTETMIDGGSSSTNGTGTSAIEAITYDAVTSTIYATNAGIFGVIDVATGEFAAIGPTGFGDVDGLAMHPFTGVLYGAVRISGDDRLITINPVTGAGTSGPRIQTTAAVGLVDIDDLAVNPVTGVLYGLANGGGGDRLVIINPTTGAVTDVGSTAPASDVEGLTVDPFGAFIGTDGRWTGNGSMWDINSTTGTGSNPRSLIYGDYESVECNIVDVNRINGTVYLDADGDGVRDVGESGTAAVTVRLYRDVNSDGLVDGGDILLTSKTTGAGGTYSFPMAATGAFVVEIDPATLPAGNSLTTDNVESANFGTSFGLADNNNDFGHNPAADLSLTKVVDNATPTVGDDVTFTLTLSNAGPATATGLEVTDVLPAGLVFVSSTPSTGGYNAGTGVWSVASLGSAGSATLDITATVTTASSLTNTAEVTSSVQSDPDSDPGNGAPAEDDISAATVTAVLPALAVSKTSDADPGPVTAGQLINYTVSVTNTGTATQTNIIIDDPLPAGVSAVPGSTNVSGFDLNTVRDAFNTQAYTANNGSTSWSGSWAEAPEATDPVAGDIQILNDTADYQLRIQDGGREITRGVDLSAAASAVLSYEYRRDGLETGEMVRVEISDGVSFREVARYEVGTDAGYSLESITLLASDLTAAARLGIVSPAGLGMDDSDAVYFDNVQIAYTSPMSGSGGDPTNLVSATDGYDLLPGETMTVTYQ